MKKDYLLVIAIDDYIKINKLSNAVKDANDIIEVLQTYYNFSKEDTIVLFDEDATRKNIFNQFVELSKKVTKNDNVIIYYAGHGHFDGNLNMGYWLPFESEINDYACYIANNEITNFIKSFNNKHTFLIVDACFAGSLLIKNRKTFAEKVEKFPSRWAFASGRMEPVSDGQVGDNSPFAKALLKILIENEYEELRVVDLISKVQTIVGNNYSQTPYGSPIFGVGDEGGEFVLRKEHNANDSDSNTLSIPDSVKVNAPRKVKTKLKRNVSISFHERWEDTSKAGWLLFDMGTHFDLDVFVDGKIVEKTYIDHFRHYYAFGIKITPGKHQIRLVGKHERKDNRSIYKSFTHICESNMIEANFSENSSYVYDVSVKYNYFTYLNWGKDTINSASNYKIYATLRKN